MASATYVKSSFISNTNSSSGRLQHRSRPAPASVAPPTSRSRRDTIKPQALYIRTYNPTSCCPSHYHRSSRLRVGLGLARTFGMLEGLLTSDWLRETKRTSCVQPVEIRTLEDRYELLADCPGVTEEDIRVEIIPDRVITIAGSRRTVRQGRKASGQQGTASDVSPPEITAPRDPEAPSEQPDVQRDPTSSVGSPPAAEVSYRFSRSFVLPEDADEEGVKAELERGVLTVTVPRRVVEKPKARRVAVTTRTKQKSASP